MQSCRKTENSMVIVSNGCSSFAHPGANYISAGNGHPVRPRRSRDSFRDMVTRAQTASCSRRLHIRPVTSRLIGYVRARSCQYEAGNGMVHPPEREGGNNNSTGGDWEEGVVLSPGSGQCCVATWCLGFEVSVITESVITALVLDGAVDREPQSGGGPRASIWRSCPGARILGTGSWVLDAEPPIWMNLLICAHRCLAIGLGRWIKMDQERHPA
ncbi:hypothetical protein EDB80DRAFT_676737 [Ilyonectria destructans]|nr:hypothetical protein EDB80DRAFT_676737 [Ilyonectria destructans]